MKNVRKQILQHAKDIRHAMLILGIKCEIEHVRFVKDFVIVQDGGAHDSCINKDEFNKSIENLTYIAPAMTPKKFGCFVSPLGGFTRVTILFPSEKILVGKYNFKPHENFYKNLGFIKAVESVAKKEIYPTLNEVRKRRNQKKQVTPSPDKSIFNKDSM